MSFGRIDIIFYKFRAKKTPINIG